MNYLIFSLARSASEAQSSVEFHLSMPMPPELIEILMRVECFNTRFPGFLCLP